MQSRPHVVPWGMNLEECYRVLELPQGASLAQVKSAYRRLARRYHPDVNPGDRTAHEKFILLHQAYEKLVRVLPTLRVPPLQSEAQSCPPQTSPPLSAFEIQLKHASYRQLQEFLKYRCYQRAISLVEGLASRLPQDAEVRQWQAITYQCWARQLIRDRQPQAAREYLHRALKADPENRTLWQEVEKDFRTLDRLYGKGI
ncbi:J domain-containing protein [uncultured Thermosynechococcus sp.]|uniref:J domain-containing protein n=1 Tax=uncultured Thermosynechococcus sp. TaxID=436945 RepID=UPI00260C06B4|nr:J domain-containing protein [uncultured Thermosynechococcus sp.]